MKKTIKFFKIFIKYINKIIFGIFKIDIITKTKQFLKKKELYIEIDISKKKTYFYAPNKLIKWRIETLYSKEPDTLEWIKNFKKHSIFWDIGANIGLYSIYAAQNFTNLEIVSFEPSTNNTRVLSKNISKNNLENLIKIYPCALSNVKNTFFDMNESSTIEGSAHSSFGKSIDQYGKEFNPENRYKIFGTTIDQLIEDEVLSVPNYIKIDVDGFEHNILDGAKKCLRSTNLKSILIELNENYKFQYNEVQKIMGDNDFKVLKKTSLTNSFYNYIFIR